MSSPQPFSSWDVCGGPSGNLEERSIERVRLRQLRERVRAGKRAAHFLLERLRVEAVDVVVAVVGEEQAAVLDEATRFARSLFGEAHELVARHEEERKRRAALRSRRDDDLFAVDRDVGVLDDRVRGRWRRPSGCSPSRPSRSEAARTRTPSPSGPPVSAAPVAVARASASARHSPTAPCVRPARRRRCRPGEESRGVRASGAASVDRPSVLHVNARRARRSSR